MTTKIDEFDERMFRDYENNPSYQTVDRCIRALSINYENSQYIRNKTESQWIDILKQRPMGLSHMVTQTENICLAIITSENGGGLLIRVVRDQTEKLCKAAIDDNPYSFVYINDKTPELSLYALVKAYGDQVLTDVVMKNMEEPLEGEYLKEYNRLKLFKGK